MLNVLRILAFIWIALILVPRVIYGVCLTALDLYYVNKTIRKNKI